MATNAKSQDLWVDEAKAFAFVELARSTAQNLARAGLLGRLAYTWSALFELVVLTALRDYFSIDDLVAIWEARPEDEWADVADRWAGAYRRSPDRRSQCDLVIDKSVGRVTLALHDGELADAVRVVGAPRTVTIIDLDPPLRQVRAGFDVFAQDGAEPNGRRVGRPPARRTVNGEVTS